MPPHRTSPEDAPQASLTGTVADIPDADLLERAVRSAGRLLPRQVRWAHVMDVFALGSGYAQQLCARFGLDPDEEVGIEEEPEDEEAYDEPDPPPMWRCQQCGGTCALRSNAERHAHGARHTMVPDPGADGADLGTITPPDAPEALTRSTDDAP